MRIAPEQLARHLEKQLAPLYTVSGDELLLTIEAADLIRLGARQAGYVEREIFNVDHHFTWTELERCSNSPSLFGERRIIDLRIPSGKPGKEGETLDQLKGMAAFIHMTDPAKGRAFLERLNALEKREA